MSARSTWLLLGNIHLRDVANVLLADNSAATSTAFFLLLLLFFLHLGRFLFFLDFLFLDFRPDDHHAAARVTSVRQRWAKRCDVGVVGTACAPITDHRREIALRDHQHAVFRGALEQRHAGLVDRLATLIAGLLPGGFLFLLLR